MSNELMIKEEKKKSSNDFELSAIEQVVMQGDLSKLTPPQRVLYYNKVCESCGLNPLTGPFSYIVLNGKLTLYAKKDASEQLRKINGISIDKLEDKIIDDLYIVKATASTKCGRTDQSTGAVTIGNLKGDQKANAIMKAETKAKRRVTLSICGMGFTDESEIDSIPNASKVDVNLSTGEIQTEGQKVSPINYQRPIETINVEPEQELTKEALESFYSSFSDDQDLTRGYVNMCMTKKGWSENRVITELQKDIAISYETFTKWRGKQGKKKSVEMTQTVLIEPIKEETKPLDDAQSIADAFAAFEGAK
jgi:hypothetical protein